MLRVLQGRLDFLDDPPLVPSNEQIGWDCATTLHERSFKQGFDSTISEQLGRVSGCFTGTPFIDKHAVWMKQLCLRPNQLPCSMRNLSASETGSVELR
ncbi:MAG: hypothetical protein ACYC0X_27315 [Pirellulaceae bacterium]